MKYCFGADVGGTTVKLGLFTEGGELVDKWEIVTRTENKGEAILPDIVKSLKAKIQEKGIVPDEVIGVGMGIPAPVNSEGIVEKTANLGWGYKEVKRELQELTGWKVAIGNDANVAALGEMWKGAGHGEKNMIMVTLGTGVGGGAIIEGKPLIGAHGAGAEIGHICVNDSEERVCGCGKKGCLEQYASATGIARLARERLRADEKVSVLREKDLEQIDAKEVFDALKGGDEVAEEIVEKFGEYLAKGLATVAVVLDPNLFVIGGGVSKAGEILIPYVQKYYQKSAFFANKEVKFTIASIGNDAGICGAAKLLLDNQI